MKEEETISNLSTEADITWHQNQIKTYKGKEKKKVAGQDLS